VHHTLHRQEAGLIFRRTFSAAKGYLQSSDSTGHMDAGRQSVSSRVQTRFLENGVISNFNSEPIDAADDPAFLEGNDSEPGGAADVESKALLLEL
jgi:hypothetical protein